MVKLHQLQMTATTHDFITASQPQESCLSIPSPELNVYMY